MLVRTQHFAAHFGPFHAEPHGVVQALPANLNRFGVRVADRSDEVSARRVVHAANIDYPPAEWPQSPRVVCFGGILAHLGA